MSASRPKMRFFLDEGVADSVGVFLATQGHEIIRLRESITTGSSDPLVCIAAEANDAILVAHDGDMKELAKRHGVSNGRFKSLNLLKLSCSEPRAIDRITQAMSLLEHEWQVSLTKRARRLYVEIGTDVIRTIR